MEEKICPINPHGNGYCKKEKCALWNKYVTSYRSNNVDLEDEITEACAFNIIAFNLFLLERKE